ncbi:hypothetical protein O987_06970 [Comamonas testosteroni TK102]|uniref:ParB-like N-terminal domain-containing protein n=1 Tax=Comamonas testosteroni TK102 TaxID=1392005 RepID=A0A076PQD4_COMTE|nr:ParB/RepB/Spo0J family partition protein [Comamonas testosteroni]AIJ45537.1 hypothetical protein O987_06970 [Comamonas testosteroni TK102]
MTNTHDTATQALPMPAAGERMDHVAIASIARSLTNPRKRFDPTKLQELADSIAASGVHQPILIRPLPGHRLEDTHREARALKQPAPEYELVAGERRWRACQLAKVAQIPAMIRPMTDEQALEVQVIENLQREDVTELEEAEGYESLMKHSKLNADQVGAKIGKSRGYVYGRLKLLDLCQQAREALREGKIDFSKALLVARIPNEQLQIKALDFMTDDDWRGEFPSYRACAQHVQNEFMLRLDSARFKITDASLLPEAGSCTDCKKRTGADQELWSDIKSADVCTDPTCFHKKADAHTAQLVRDAQDKGQNVITGAEAAELASDHWGNSKLKGYRRLDSTEDSPTDAPLRKIIGAQMEAEGIQPTKVEHPRKKGELIDVLPNETVLRLLKIVDGQAKASKEVAKEVRAFAYEKKVKAKAKADAKFERAWRDGLIDRTWTEITSNTGAGFTTDLHRYLMLRTVRSLSSDDAAAVADVLGLDRVGAHNALIQHAKETSAPDQLHMLCIMQTDSRVNDHSYGDRVANEGLMLVSGGVLKDQLQTVIKEVKAAAADEHLPKPDPVNSAAPKADLPQQPAARAGGGAARSKKVAGKGSAAGANEVPKTSAAHASAQIAEALQELEGSGAAAAAQGVDGAPVADAQAPTTGADAQSNEAAPVDAVASQDLPHSSTASADDQAEDDDKQQPAAATRQWTAEELVAERVQILKSATGKQQKPWIGYEGTVVAQIGPESVDVSIVRAPRCKPIRVAFHISEVEVIQ